MRSKAWWMLTLASSLWSLSGSAQTLSSSPQPRNLDPSVVAMLFAASEAVAPHQEAAAPAVSAQPGPTWEEQRTYRGARWMKATGLGLTMGALIGGFLAGRARHCEYQDIDLDKRTPRIAAAVIGGVGLGLAIGGGIRLRRVSPEVRAELGKKRSEHRGMVAAAVGLTLLSSVAIGLTALPESFQCLSS
jgi:hypothetical protein